MVSTGGWNVVYYLTAHGILPEDQLGVLESLAEVLQELVLLNLVTMAIEPPAAGLHAVRLVPGRSDGGFVLASGGNSPDTWGRVPGVRAHAT